MKSDPETERVGRSGVAHLVAPLLAWRACLLFLMLASIVLLPNMFDVQKWSENPHWPAEAEGPDLTTHFKTWDSQHYIRIAEAGYEPGSKTSAFYPLWPLVIRTLAPIFGGNAHLASLVAANILAILACLLLYDVVARRMGEGPGRRTLLLLLAFPGAFFLGLPYSESLFLLLIALFFWALERERIPLAGTAAFFLPICRPTGVLILLPFLVHRYLQHRDRGEGLLRPAMLWILSPLAGFALYLGIMALMTGDPLEGFAAQDRFHTASTIGRLFDVPGFVAFFIQGAVSLHGVTTSLIDRLWFVWLLLCLPALWRFDKTWFSFALVMGLVPAMTAPIVSFTRYAVVLFPVFAITARFLDRPDRRSWTLPILLLFAGIQGLFLLRHINNMWAG